MFQNLLGKNSVSRKTRIFFILILAASPCNAEDRQSLLYSRDLLYAHNFSALDTRLKQTNDDYLAGQLSTRDYYAVFQTLWTKQDIETQANSALEGHLKQWLVTTQSAYALAALGKFYARLGYKQRGGKWSTETSKDQFTNMRASFRQAQELLAQSQGLDNHILFAYLTMANIQKSLPNTPKHNQTHKNKRSFEQMAFAILPTPIQAIITYFFPSRANTPHTYQTSTRLEVFQSPFFKKAPQQIWEREAIWNDILFNATPRWGGSYTEMQFIIDHDIPQYYPEFNTHNQRYFESWIIEDKLRVLYRAKKFEEGQQQAQHAINNGSVSAGMYKQAIYLARKTKRFDDCYNYAKHLTEKRPWRVKNWDNLGFCAFKLQRWEDMNTAYQHAIYLRGETKYRLYQLGISYMYLHEYAKAYPLFLSAKALDPDYAKYTDQYTQYIEDKKPEARSLEKLSAIDIIGVLHYTSEQ
ncbi:MAG: tetratricopeptide (TPR) repeat protein [Granulosicoccus sp.]|jgi:tetratricopeptide (TPR) repeat protein